MALRSPKTSQGPTDSEAPHRKRSRSWVITRSLLVILILTAAGALIAVGVVEGKGVQYRASIDVRSATADATCVYFTCPQPVSTTQGNPYVLDQVNAILSPALAAQVARKHFSGTVTPSQLLSHVCAKEIGQSATIQICYQSPSTTDAQRIAAAYADQYVAWSNDQAVASLQALKTSLNKVWFGQLTPAQQSGLRGQTLRSQIDAVDQAETAFSHDDGPNGAKIFGGNASTQVETTRATTSPAKAGAIGAAAGLVLAVGLLLILPPLIRRPSDDDSDGRRGPGAPNEESLDLFTAPVDEPVR